jgi:hypothetical protein
MEYRIFYVSRSDSSFMIHPSAAIRCLEFQSPSKKIARFSSIQKGRGVVKTLSKYACIRQS